MTSLDKLVILQKNRLAVLSALYEMSGSNSERLIEISDIINIIEASKKDVSLALNYLFNEGLVGGITALTPEGTTLVVANITHKGIKEIEHAIEFPNQRTSYFQASVIQNFHAPIGVVQNGNNTSSIFQEKDE